MKRIAVVIFAMLGLSGVALADPAIVSCRSRYAGVTVKLWADRTAWGTWENGTLLVKQSQIGVIYDGPVALSLQTATTGDIMLTWGLVQMDQRTSLGQLCLVDALAEVIYEYDLECRE